MCSVWVHEGTMMMTGKRLTGNPTVDVPPWSPFEDQAPAPAPVEFHGIGGQVAADYLLSEAALAEMQCYLPLNEVEAAEGDELADPPVDAYSCDEFRMYDFKVHRCARGRSHDWTECPYAHPGEKARRRDPRKHHYSGTACPEFRKGSCKKGDACEFSHGVFECWLHPARYRTQPCKDGTACRRRVCFFAHTPEQLRVIPPQPLQGARTMDSYDGSPLRHHAPDAYFHKGFRLISSPTSTLISTPTDSPPISPIGSGIRRSSWPTGSTLNEVIEAMRSVRFSKAMKSMPSSSSPVQESGLGSPVGRRPGFFSLPSTPTGSLAVGSGMIMEGVAEKDEPAERVESGRALRAKMYEKLSKDRGTAGDDPNPSAAAAVAPDIGWVSDLVK